MKASPPTTPAPCGRGATVSPRRGPRSPPAAASTSVSAGCGPTTSATARPASTSAASTCGRSRWRVTDGTGRLPTRLLIAFGLPGFPLAALTVPLYVYLPAFYADEMGLGLAAVGAILLAARLLDVAI